MEVGRVAARRSCSVCLYVQGFEFNAFTADESLPVRPVRTAAKEEPSKDGEKCGKNDVQAGVQSFAASDRCNQNDVENPKQYGDCDTAVKSRFIKAAGGARPITLRGGAGGTH